MTLRRRLAYLEHALRPRGRMLVWFRAGADLWERCIVPPDATPDLPLTATRADLERHRRARPDDVLIVDREHS